MSKKQALRSIEAPIFDYLEAIYKSFYSARLYVDVAKRWRGYGLKYLLLVLALVVIPLSLRLLFQTHDYIYDELLYPFQKLPTIYVQKGEVSINKPVPYFIKNKDNQVVGLVDTRESPIDVKKKYPNLTIFISKNSITIHPPAPHFIFNDDIIPTEQMPIKFYQFDKQMNEVIIGKDIADFTSLKLSIYFVELMLYPMVVMVFFGIYIAVLFCFAFLGKVFASTLFHVKLTYRQSFRLLAVVCTPQLFLLFFMLATGWIFPGAGWIYLALLTLYFSFAVLSLKRDSQKLVRM